MREEERGLSNEKGPMFVQKAKIGKVCLNVCYWESIIVIHMRDNLIKSYLMIKGDQAYINPCDPNIPFQEKVLSDLHDLVDDIMFDHLVNHSTAPCFAG